MIRFQTDHIVVHRGIVHHHFDAGEDPDQIFLLDRRHAETKLFRVDRSDMLKIIEPEMRTQFAVGTTFIHAERHIQKHHIFRHSQTSLR